MKKLQKLKKFKMSLVQFEDDAEEGSSLESCIRSLLRCMNVHQLYKQPDRISKSETSINLCPNQTKKS